jgi:N-acetylglucosamine kinase-like BadF-type ATPase
MPQLFLGVDGGQSSTTALIADSTGRVLGMGHGGPCNHVQSGDGRTKFENALQGCVLSACIQAQLDPNTVHFQAACLGFSGGPKDKDPIVRHLIRATHYDVTNDGIIALTGATAGQPGIIVVAGTGQIAYGRNARHQFARAGGWGYIFGDEGGGFDIARQALRAALRMEEGWGPPTALHAKLLAATNTANANDLMHIAYTPALPRPQFAALSQLVDQAAIDGDRIAIDILNAAAQQLAAFAGSVRHAIFAPGEIAVVCPVGSVYRSDILRQRFELLISLEDLNRYALPTFGPASGALIQAWQLAGLTPPLDQLPKAEK